jgi:hypothetical protein
MFDRPEYLYVCSSRIPQEVSNSLVKEKLNKEYLPMLKEILEQRAHDDSDTKVKTNTTCTKVKQIKEQTHG